MHFLKSSPEDSDADGQHSTALGGVRGVTLVSQAAGGILCQ